MVNLPAVLWKGRHCFLDPEGEHQTPISQVSAVERPSPGLVVRLVSARPPHSPGGSAPESVGESSSQSASSAVPRRLLLNCFPPFTFQVPMAIRIRLKLVNSDWRSDIALRIRGVTTGRHTRHVGLHPPEQGRGLCLPKVGAHPADVGPRRKRLQPP